MSSYKVENYDIFDNLVDNNKNLSTELKNINNIIEEQIKSLKSEDYSGKIFDNFINYLTNLKKIIDDITEDFSKMNTDLNQICKNYKELDKKASQAISNNSNSSNSGSKEVNFSTTVPNVTPSGKYSTYANPQNVNDYRLTFINAISDKAVDMYSQYKTLPSLTMAQAILESGWGRGTKGNNLYNIRTSADSGRMYVDDGLTGTYRAYNTIYEAMDDYGQLLNGSRYASVLAASDYREAAYNVKACGYASDPNYVSKLINLIEKYGLDQWDPK